MSISALTQISQPITGRLHRLAVVACGLSFFAWSYPALVNLHNRWTGSTIEHGYAIAVMSAILIALHWRPPSSVSRADEILGASLLGACAVLTVFAHAAGIVILPQLLFPVALLAFIWAIFGAGRMRRLLLPVAFLYFAMPFWQVLDFTPVSAPSLNEGLRLLTTYVVSLAIGLTTIPALIDGAYIHVPSGVFEIADGCSGRAYFLAAAELSVFYGLAYFRHWQPRLLLIAAAIALALVGNWVRVFALIVIGHVTEMQHSLVADHTTFGWVVFAISLSPLMLIANRLDDVTEGGSAAPHEAQPVSMSVSVVTPVIVCAIGLAAALTNYRVDRLYAADIASVSIDPPSVRRWISDGNWAGDTQPVFPGAASSVAVIYQRDDFSLGAYAADFPVQRQGHEAVYYANRPFGSVGSVTTRDDFTIVDDRGTQYPISQFVVDQDRETRLVWMSMQIAGEAASNPLAAKWLQAVGALRGRVDAQVVVLGATCNSSCDDAKQSVTEFATSSLHELFLAAEASSIPLDD